MPEVVFGEGWAVLNSFSFNSFWRRASHVFGKSPTALDRARNRASKYAASTSRRVKAFESGAGGWPELAGSVEAGLGFGVGVAGVAARPLVCKSFTIRTSGENSETSIPIWLCKATIRERQPLHLTARSNNWLREIGLVGVDVGCGADNGWHAHFPRRCAHSAWHT